MTQDELDIEAQYLVSLARYITSKTAPHNWKYFFGSILESGNEQLPLNYYVLEDENELVLDDEHHIDNMKLLIQAWKQALADKDLRPFDGLAFALKRENKGIDVHYYYDEECSLIDPSKCKRIDIVSHFNEQTRFDV
ncbi:MAG: hypothetical protein Q4E22_02180 [Coriobacteriia bacterium]|nr:hypothetical protein [Coriobacteriia bacterium]